MPISLQELRESGLINITYPDSLRGAVEKAVDSWKNFCQLPATEKMVFTFLEDKHGDGAGYELKEKKESKRDLKENFHVTLFQHTRLTQIANNRTFPFLNDAKILLDRIEPLIVEFAESLEKEYKMEGLVAEVKSSKPYWILRYLHYFGDQEEGCEIAAPHADKGGFTLHLFESDAGLEYYCMHQSVWKPMPVDEKQTVIIPAIQLQLWSKGDLKALYHRVVATEKTARQGRFSMVCFIPFQSIPMYNKKLYGSMQVHETGFNYRLSHQEFARLFA
jgi:isopenicillin N synthase-like dioxygenase